MFKPLIIIFAVYFVSVYAFVKRDAPAAAPGAVDDIQSKISEATKEATDSVSKNYNAAADNIGGSVDKLKAKVE